MAQIFLLTNFVAHILSKNFLHSQSETLTSFATLLVAHGDICLFL